MEKATIKTARNYQEGTAEVRGVLWDAVAKEEVSCDWSLTVNTKELPAESLSGLALYGLRMVNDIVNSDKSLTTNEEKLAKAQEIVQQLLDGTYAWERARKSGDVVKVSKKAVAGKLDAMTDEEREAAIAMMKALGIWQG